MKTKVPVFLSLAVLLVFSLIAPAAAQGPAPDGNAPAPHAAPRFDSASGLRQDENGLWHRGDGIAEASATAAAPDAGGGPDDFGYTWADTSLNWIDVGGGADAGVANNYTAGPIDIGFPFRYYERTNSQLWITRFGYVTFSSAWSSQEPIPSAGLPNEVIAPLWAPTYSVDGYVRYLRGGAAPNRWFAVEWNRVRDSYSDYTFEVILYENGNIRFQYGALNNNVSSSSMCVSAGIEDSQGLDGLAVIPWCNWPFNRANTAVLFTRPAAAARVNLFPRAQGSFGAPNKEVSFNQTVRNTGELGVDTYDLYVDSPWPTALYHADGVSPLTDTDGDGQIDTGPVDQGGAKTLVVKTRLPGDAVVGAGNTAQVTAMSSRNPTKQRTARFQAAVPAPFAAGYSQSGRTTLGYYRPGQQATRQTNDPAGNSYGYSPAAATLPNGRIVQVWQQGRYLPNNGPWVNELYYALTDKEGNILRAAAKITDLSGANSQAYDSRPAVAVSPDGHIGIAWYRTLYRNNYNEHNYNIHFLVLDGNGDMVVQPTNITNNGNWGSWNNNNSFQLYDPTIAATPNNRFGIAWTRYTYDGSNSTNTIWYAMRGANGGEVRGPTQFADNTRSWNPNLTTLADGSLFLAIQTIGNLGYGRLDAAGNIVTPLITLLGPTVYPDPDAVQLPNGNIVVAWANGPVQYVVLNSALQVVKTMTSLSSLSPTRDYYASVTTSGNRAVLTWGDDCCDYMPNLYYALLDDAGNIVTPPMIFFSDYSNYYVRLGDNGQGNTPLIGDKPPQSKANSPEFAAGAIPVTWWQTGGDAAIARYDVWVRHGYNGAWTPWLTGANETHATYSGATAGEYVYFRSVATDILGNVEMDVPDDGDSYTLVAAKEITGRVFNARGEPIYWARIDAEAPALAPNYPKRSDGRGAFRVFYETATGKSRLQVGRPGFNFLAMNMDLASTDAVEFALGPVPELLLRGYFEDGDLRGWTAESSAPPTLPVVTSVAAHTGQYGLRMDFDIALESGKIMTGPALSYRQSVSTQTSLPGYMNRPTLSLFYRVTKGIAEGQLEVSVVGGEETAHVALPLTEQGWTHLWLPLDDLKGELLTVKIEAVSASPGWQVDIDEVSVGDTEPGSYPAFLPIMRR